MIGTILASVKIACKRFSLQLRYVDAIEYLLEPRSLEILLMNVQRSDLALEINQCAIAAHQIFSPFDIGDSAWWDE